MRDCAMIGSSAERGTQLDAKTVGKMSDERMCMTARPWRATDYGRKLLLGHHEFW